MIGLIVCAVDRSWSPISQPKPMRTKILRFPIVPGLLILIGVISLGSLFCITVPKAVVSTYATPSILSAIVREILLDYTTTTVSCTGVVPMCFVRVSPYTYTETWSGQTTPLLPETATTTTHVAYAFSGVPGALTVLFALILLIVGIVLLATNHRRSG